MFSQFRSCIKSQSLLFAAVTAVTLAVPVMASAEEVTLRLKGGGFSVSGDLVAYEDSKYVIESQALGRMTLDASRFDCEGDGCPDASGNLATASIASFSRARRGSQSVQIAGSNTVGNQLMPALIEAFARRSGLKITRLVGEDPLDLDFNLLDENGTEIGKIALRRHGSSTSFRELAAKTAEIGMSSRPIKDAEVAKLRAAGLGDMKAVGSEHVIGLDGLLILVSPDNPAVSLPITTVAKIFSGEIKDWSDVGLPPGKINLYAPGPDSGTFDTFKSLVLKPNDVELDASTRRTEDHAQQSDWVARDPMGIGVVGIAYQRNAKALNIENSCGLISRPTIFSMKTEEYPLSRRLYLYTSGTPRKSLTRSLLAFSLSDLAQPVVRQSDFVDQTPELLTFDEQSARIAYALNAPAEDFDIDMMRTLIGDMKPARRLTATFRFRVASFVLDNKAQQDIKRLAALLKRDDYAGRNVKLFGFADAQGGFQSNLDLSRSRANAVRGALVEEGGDDLGSRLTAKGFSELAPVACNTDEDGRQFNRRVEVWVE